ncbi:MAG: F0F1 ATP synthase subunit epsilon [Desulfosalsimonadaceae bacterium]
MAQQTIKLEIVTPEKYVVSQDVRIVMAPGTEGEFGILPNHTPFLSSLETGRVHFRDLQDMEHVVFISGGFSEALPDRVTILAETAEIREKIDIDRAKAAYERARERLESSEEGIDKDRAKAALERATARIKLVETKE